MVKYGVMQSAFPSVCTVRHGQRRNDLPVLSLHLLSVGVKYILIMRRRPRYICV